MKPADNQANMQNLNKGVKGVNRQAVQVQGHRGMQIAKQGGGKSGQGKSRGK